MIEYIRIQLRNEWIGYWLQLDRWAGVIGSDANQHLKRRLPLVDGAEWLTAADWRPKQRANLHNSPAITQLVDSFPANLTR